MIKDLGYMKHDKGTNHIATRYMIMLHVSQAKPRREQISGGPGESD